MPIGIDVNAGVAAMRALQQRIRSLGLADFLDINIPQGRIVAQLQLLKRMMNQAKISDLLEVNLDRASLQHQLSELSNITQTIPVKFDVSQLQALGPVGSLTQHLALDDTGALATLAGLQARMTALGRNLTNFRIGADDTAAEAAIARLQAQLATLVKTTDNIRLAADTSKLDAQIAVEQAKLAALTARANDLNIEFSSTALARLDATIAAIQAKIATLTSKAADIKIGFSVDTAEMATAEARVLALEAAVSKLKMPTGQIQGLGTVLKIMDLSLMKAAMDASGLTIDLTTADTATGIWSRTSMNAGLAVAQMGADLLKLDTALKDTAGIWNELAAAGDLLAAGSKLQTQALASTAAAARLSATAFKTLGPAVDAPAGSFAALAARARAVAPLIVAAGAAAGGAGGGWGILTRNVTLFGGIFGRVLPLILTSVSVWHIAADAIVEIAAVVIPASLALVAFGVAGAAAAQDIYTQMKNVRTVMSATQQIIYPMTGALQQLQDAVRPQVYQLFGDAITIMNAKTGAFATIARGTATVVDQLGARFTYAVTTGNTLNEFMKNAVQDVSQLGNLIGNLGGILGNVLKAVPGYANILLGLAVGFTHIIEVATRVGEPVIAFGLALHGAFLYVGLAVTGSLALIGALARLGAAFVTFAGAQVLSGVGALTRFGSLLTTIGLSIAAYIESIILADGATATFAATLAPIAAIDPLFWVAAAAAGLAVLVTWLSRSKDAAQQFNDAMQKTIQNASLGSLVVTIQAAQAATAVKLAQAQVQLTQVTATSTATELKSAQSKQSLATAAAKAYAAVNQQATSVAQLNSGQAVLAQQSVLVNSRMASLSKAYGGNVAALGLLNAAGITSAQITSTNAQTWAEALIQIQATQQAYKAMGQQAGLLGSDLNALTLTGSDQVTAVGTLNNAWDQFFTIIGAGQTAFVTFQQSLATVATNAAASGASLSGLNNQSLTLRASWNSLIPQANAVLDAIRQQAAAASLGAQGTKLTIRATQDLVAEMLQYGNANASVRASIIAVAQEADPSIQTWQQVTQWVGNKGAAGAALDLNAIMAILQGTVSNLTKDVQALTKGLSALVQQQMVQAINQADQMQAKLSAVAAALQQSGAGSKAFSTSLYNLLPALIKETGSTGAAHDALIAFLEQMGIAPGLAKQMANSVQAGSQQLQKLADQTGTTKTAFEQFSAQLGISKGVADQLWTTLRQQYLDTLATKVNTNKQDWINLATQGLDISRTAAENLWTQLRLQYLDTVAAKAGETRGKFVDLATQFGLTAQDATNMWNILKGIATGSPYAAVLRETGTGIFTITGSVIAASQGPGGSGNAGGGLAAGGKINMGTGPTADDVLVRVSKGETVVSAADSRRLAPAFKALGIPGYATGGKVGSSSSYSGPYSGLGPAASSFTTNFDNTMTQAMEAAMTTTTRAAQAAANAAAAAVKAAAGAVSAAGLTNSSGYAALKAAAASVGWTGAQWQALVNVEMREAGFNLTAQNPTSGAYGMAQFIGGPGEYAQYGGNANTYSGQAAAMVNYIIQRYGTPAAAWAHEQNFGWYDKGGWLQPGMNLAWNGTGRPEQVSPPGGGGTDQGMNIVAELRALRAELQQLTHVTASTGTSFGRALQGTARQAGQRGQYTTRRMPL